MPQKFVDTRNGPFVHTVHMAYAIACPDSPTRSISIEEHFETLGQIDNPFFEVPRAMRTRGEFYMQRSGYISKWNGKRWVCEHDRVRYACKDVGVLEFACME